MVCYCFACTYDDRYCMRLADSIALDRCYQQRLQRQQPLLPPPPQLPTAFDVGQLTLGLVRFVKWLGSYHTATRPDDEHWPKCHLPNAMTANSRHSPWMLIVAVTDCYCMLRLLLMRPSSMRYTDTMNKLNCTNVNGGDDGCPCDCCDSRYRPIYCVVFVISNSHLAHCFYHKHPRSADDRVFPMRKCRDLSAWAHVCSWQLWVLWREALENEKNNQTELKIKCKLIVWNFAKVEWNIGYYQCGFKF